MTQHSKTPWRLTGEIDAIMVLSFDNKAVFYNEPHNEMSPSQEDTEFIVTAVNSHEELLEACRAAFHALRSFQFGNSATELAEEIANVCEVAIKKAEGRK